MRERAAVLLDSGRLVRWRTGSLAEVEADGAWAFRREERRGDVAGFFHSHPPGCPGLSSRDRRTMDAWVVAFGKPLLCAVACDGRVRVWLWLPREDAREISALALVRRLFE